MLRGLQCKFPKKGVTESVPGCCWEPSLFWQHLVLAWMEDVDLQDVREILGKGVLQCFLKTLQFIIPSGNLHIQN